MGRAYLSMLYGYPFPQHARTKVLNLPVLFACAFFGRRRTTSTSSVHASCSSGHTLDFRVVRVWLFTPKLAKLFSNLTRIVKTRRFLPKNRVYIPPRKKNQPYRHEPSKMHQSPLLPLADSRKKTLTFEQSEFSKKYPVCVHPHPPPKGNGQPH